RLRAADGVAAVLLVLACAFGAPAQDSRETERKLDRAQRELQAISAERRKLEGQRGSASRELRALDEKLAAASRALHDTEARIARQQKELAELQARRKTLDASLATQKAQLAALLRSAYTIGDDAPLKLLLSQDSVAEANRLLALHRYLQADRARRVDSLTRELRELAEVEQRIAERQRELDATRARQRTQLAALQDERKAHARAVAQLEAKYQDKRSRRPRRGRGPRGRGPRPPRGRAHRRTAAQGDAAGRHRAARRRCRLAAVREPDCRLRRQQFRPADRRARGHAGEGRGRRPGRV